jgi:general stress protein YciG
MAKPGLAQANRSTRQRVARAGGLAVSRNRKHMSKIGRRGGKHKNIQIHKRDHSKK